MFFLSDSLEYLDPLNRLIAMPTVEDTSYRSMARAHFLLSKTLITIESELLKRVFLLQQI